MWHNELGSACKEESEDQRQEIGNRLDCYFVWCLQDFLKCSLQNNIELALLPTPSQWPIMSIV